MKDYGGTFVIPGHDGPFKSRRILTNEAARYGTFNEPDTSEEGDTTNADRIITSDGHHVDVLCTPITGKIIF